MTPRIQLSTHSLPATLERALKKTGSFALGVLAGLTITVWALVLVSQWVDAATFNNTFNNIEQGPNSTANPVITISGGTPVESKKSAPVAATAPNEVAPPAPVAPQEQIGPGVQTVAQTGVSPVSPTQEVSPVRLGLFLETTGTKNQSRRNRAHGGMLSLSYVLNPSFAISALGGALTQQRSYYGAELEVTPIHLAIFDAKDLLDVGFLVGGTSLGKGTPHLGLKGALNFGPRYAIVAQVRGGITSQDDQRLGTGDLGFTMRF